MWMLWSTTALVICGGLQYSNINIDVGAQETEITENSHKLCCLCVVLNFNFFHHFDNEQ